MRRIIRWGKNAVNRTDGPLYFLSLDGREPALSEVEGTEVRVPRGERTITQMAGRERHMILRKRRRE